MSPTRDQCIAEAGEVYGAILADPDRREQLRAAREQRAHNTSARPTSTGEKPAERRPHPRRKSA